MAEKAERKPVIETARLRLRPHRLDDFDAVAAMWADPRVFEHISGSASTREQSRARLLRYAGHWAMLDYGYWAVEERDSHAFVGDVGFGDYHREIEPSFNGVPELGWVLAPHAHGKGYATEAALAAIAWGQEHFADKPRIACIIVPEHLASIRVAEKCDFALHTRTTYMDSPVLLYSRPLHLRPGT
ncbi:MAG: GNAT family N-acetyltransferase [Vulcanimicrobiaceae bacterium]